MNDDATLEEVVKDFFNNYLNVVEESDSGHMFSPTYVSSCRALEIGPLGEVLDNMRKLSGADEHPLQRKKQ